MAAPVKALTQKRFWDRIETAARTAEVRGAKFDGDDNARQLRRKAEAVVWPERFNLSYLPHYFRCAPSPMHSDMYRALEQKARIVARAPRGHAKSTTITFAYPLHQVVCAPVLRAWEEGRLEDEDPDLYAAIVEVLAEAGDAAPKLFWDPYIQIIAVTLDTAIEFTAAIKQELQDNALLLYDWGLDSDDGGRVLLEGRQSDRDFVSATNVRVRAFGMDGSIRGGKHRQWRPRLAIFDDPDSKRTVGTVAVRDRMTRNITAAVNYGLEPGVGRVFMVGTPLHPDCQVCRFTRDGQFERWHKMRYAAILPDGVTVLWPERWTLEQLRDEEADDPEAFLMEMMDVPPSTGKPFHTTHHYARADFEGVDLPSMLIFDPALGKTDKSDYQALVILRGPTADGWVLVHRCELLRIGDPRELIRYINDIVAFEDPDHLVIEAIGFQLLMEVMLVDDAGTRGMLTGWETIESQTENKDLRLRGMAPAWNQGRVRIPDDRSCRNLQVQAEDYPDGKRDGLDALEMGWRRMRRASRRGGGVGLLQRIKRRAAGFGRGAW